MQSHFNNEAIDLLPRVKQEIIKANNFERNQMVDFTLRAILNSTCPIVHFNQIEIDTFSSNIIERFKEKGWII